MAQDESAIVRDKKRVKDQLGDRADYTIRVSKWKPQRLNIFDDYFKVESRTDGHSFKLSKATLGSSGGFKLGDLTAGAWTTDYESTSDQYITDGGVGEVTLWLYNDTGSRPQYISLGTDSTNFNKNQSSLGTEVSSRIELYEYDISFVTGFIGFPTLWETWGS